MYMDVVQESVSGKGKGQILCLSCVGNVCSANILRAMASHAVLDIFRLPFDKGHPFPKMTSTDRPYPVRIILKTISNLGTVKLIEISATL